MRPVIAKVRRLPLKTSALIGVVTLIILALIITLFVELASDSCSQTYRDDESVNINGQDLQVQVAKTPAELTEGLSGKSCIGDGQAMLFPFGRAANYSFWMKGMKFPIDIVWIDSKHQVVQIDANVSPRSYPKTYQSKQVIQYVLEMKAGAAHALGIKIGSLINL